MQLDIEVQFLKPNLTQEPIPPELLAQNAACSTSGAAKRGIFGPFGILVLTTPNLEEQTAVFFSFVHSRRNGWKTIVCSDQSRCVNQSFLVTTEITHSNVELKLLGMSLGRQWTMTWT